MPELALFLCAAWVLLLVVVRAAVQWSKTGSTGIIGMRGRLGSREWFAALTASVGLMLVPIAPLATLQDWSFQELLFYNIRIHQAGAVLVLVGIAGAFAAQVTMGNSWRVGVDQSERTELVTTGIYQWVRNPIFSFIGVSIVGYALVIPNLWMLVATTLLGLGVQLQVRFVEEPYLLAQHGEKYQSYMARVGRFLPAVGKSPGQMSSRGVVQ